MNKKELREIEKNVCKRIERIEAERDMLRELRLISPTLMDDITFISYKARAFDELMTKYKQRHISGYK